METIEDLKAAYAAATPGEWFARKGDTFNPERTYGIVRVLSPDEHGCDPEDGERTEVIAEVFDTAHDEGHADAHLIALMKNALPALIECAERLNELLGVINADRNDGYFIGEEAGPVIAGAHAATLKLAIAKLDRA